MEIKIELKYGDGFSGRTHYLIIETINIERLTNKVVRILTEILAIELVHGLGGLEQESHARELAQRELAVRQIDFDLKDVSFEWNGRM